jgi:hypothetical protein
MVSAISTATHVQPAAQTGNTPQKAAQSKPAPANNTDTVQLSQAAQAKIAAMQEARETANQTTQEASHGDVQAQRLLAKEAAAAPVKK